MKDPRLNRKAGDSGNERLRLAHPRAAKGDISNGKFKVREPWGAEPRGHGTVCKNAGACSRGNTRGQCGLGFAKVG